MTAIRDLFNAWVKRRACRGIRDNACMLGCDLSGVNDAQIVGGLRTLEAAAKKLPASMADVAERLRIFGRSGMDL